MGEHALQSGQRLGAELVAVAQLELAVRPRGVNLHPTAALLLAQRPLPHLGVHLAVQVHQMKMVQHNPGV